MNDDPTGRTIQSSSPDVTPSDDATVDSTANDSSCIPEKLEKKTNIHITDALLNCEDFVKNIRKEKEPTQSIYTVGSYIILIVSVSLVLGFAAFVMINISTTTTGVNKKQINDDIITAVNNGADLRAINQIYINTPLELKGFSVRAYYNINVYLSTILEDIRSDHFMSSNDTIIDINKIDALIS